jgi:aminoglycoside phosphotransferase (APT) family kinase protein
VDLPPFPDISPETLRRTAKRHELPTEPITALPAAGIFNRIYLLGPDHVLRIPRHAAPFTAALRKEPLAVPAARSAGVHTPALVVFDDALDLLPVPYAVYQRVAGETLESLNLPPNAASAVWREVGRDLALLHEGVPAEGPTAGLETEPLPDPRGLPDELAAAGHFSAEEARWLRTWLDRLAPPALTPVPPRFRHGDLQASNILVSNEPSYRALIDGGACGWGDPAYDFAGIPLRAVPAMLAGYRELCPVAEGDQEARILWRHLQIALYLLS